MQHAPTAYALFDLLSFYKDNPSLSDVKVAVGNKEFDCHRLLLAAGSEFFAAAFRSDMKESREGKITLENVDEEVFSTLLTCLYSGKYVLTDENLFDIWAAADMLQISLLILQCEELFSELLSPENCVKFVSQVRHISAKAKHAALEITARNFSYIDIKQDIIKELELDEIKFLVSSQELVVDSEDGVFEMLFVWNYRKLLSNKPDSPEKDTTKDFGHENGDDTSTKTTGLAGVLECVRYLLISKTSMYGNHVRCLQEKGDPEVQDILTRILDYQAQPHLHQTWCPAAALHRDHSDVLNVLLTCRTTNNDQIMVLNPQNMEWGELLLSRSPLSDRAISNIICHDSKLLFITDGNSAYTYYGGIKTWQSVPFSKTGIVCDIGDSLFVCKKLPTKEVRISKLNSFYRIFDRNSCQWRSLGIVDLKGVPGLCTLNNVTSIGDSLVLFYNNKYFTGYIIQVLSTSSFLYGTFYSQLDSTSKLVTIRYSNEAFALQENGCLWRIKVHPENLRIEATQELALWDGTVSLNGAVLYNNQLVIVGDFLNQTKMSETLDASLDGVFQSVNKVRYRLSNQKDSPGVILASIPKDFIRFPTKA
ncbi:kelch-like protein 40b [Elysia marginata]|uniref:Kelch-like protein 40b n=1 Tax=Elysia marginata TaxID=1093978 RepID=A0AAV4IH30_9GAST|nr:kelch-like protein 40b [Elysia marginata]